MSCDITISWIVVDSITVKLSLLLQVQDLALIVKYIS